MTITARIHHVQQTILALEATHHRAPGSVQLVAVTKGRTVHELREAMHAGVCHFAENYYQEALPKIHAFTSHPLCWHFIGPIQRNKTTGIATHFDWVHSLCRMDIAERLNHARPAAASPLHVCIQINIDHEPTKAGLLPDEVLNMARTLLTLPRLCLRGLMVIPKPSQITTDRYASFLKISHLLSQINQTLGTHLDTLSMGMSDDLDEAIHAGSTLVRVGRGLFGERP